VELPPLKKRDSKSSLDPPEAVWCYESVDENVKGPMPFRDLRNAALVGKIKSSQWVWREGGKDRYQAETIVGLLPVSTAPVEEDSGPRSALDDDNPYATPQAERTIAEGPPGGLYLPYLQKVHFPLLLAFLLAGVALLLGALFNQDPQTQIILFSFSGIALVLWVAFSLAYLKRAWDMIGILGAPMNGTKAISILLIPFFNSIWSFVAIFGWARIWNLNVKKHPELSMAHSVWLPVFLLFCIAMMMTEVIALMLIVSKDLPNDILNPRHQFALTTFVATFILSLITWFQLCCSVNFLARKKS
jgi:hypothetical protein